MDQTQMMFWGKELVAYSILVPMVWFLLRQITKDITRWFDRMLEAVERHEESDLRNTDLVSKQVEALGGRISKTKLSPEQAKRILENEMKMISIVNKLPFLENVMRENHITNREEYIKEKVKAGLMSHSQVYMNYFSDFVCSAGNLADWLTKNFTDEDFDKFALEIGEIVCRQDREPKEEVIKNKLQEITTIMTLLQLRLAESLLRECKEKEKSSAY